MAKACISSFPCTPRSSVDEESDRDLNRVDSDASVSSTFQRIAVQGTCNETTTSHRVVHSSAPLPFLSLAYLWCIITHLLVSFFPYVGLTLLVGAIYSKVCTYICAILLGTLLLPRSPHLQSTVDLMDSLVFTHWRRAVQYKVIHPAGLDPSQQYLLAAFPHGAFPLASQLHASIWPRLSKRALKILVANVLFRVPVWRHYMSVGGCIPASKASLQHTLKAGHSALVLVGGIAEMFMLRQNQETIMLRKRRGFVRAAIEAGVPILPVYYFGQSRVLSFGPRVLSSLSRRCQASIGFVYGPWGMPTPRRVPITVAVGHPVAVRKLAADDAKFEQHVDEVHAQYTAAIKKLYEEHREEYHDGCSSWQTRPLVVV